MSDGIGSSVQRGGGDLGRAVERISAAVRQDARTAGKQQWLGQVGDALRAAQPLVDRLAAASVDPIALGEARDRIAAMLAEVQALSGGLAGQRGQLADTLDGLASGVPIPIAPGASEDAVAAAQAVAQLIAANARPAIAAQARISPTGIKSVLGD